MPAAIACGANSSSTGRTCQCTLHSIQLLHGSNCCVNVINYCSGCMIAVRLRQLLQLPWHARVLCCCWSVGRVSISIRCGHAGAALLGSRKQFYMIATNPFELSHAATLQHSSEQAHGHLSRSRHCLQADALHPEPNCKAVVVNNTILQHTFMGSILSKCSSNELRTAALAPDGFSCALPVFR